MSKKSNFKEEVFVVDVKIAVKAFSKTDALTSTRAALNMVCGEGKMHSTDLVEFVYSEPTPLEPHESLRSFVSGP